MRLLEDPGPLRMTHPAAPDDLLALVDRAAEVARRVEGADAFEIRADVRRDWRLGIQDDRPLGSKLEEGAALGIL
ncbi:MAG TPA: hypothetical protein VM582_01785, partial [Candidatus Thermoplasmatota archaeon]|nr:hypothetical protein [Candidatus Thermoplasmatota archaeon]